MKINIKNNLNVNIDVKKYLKLKYIIPAILIFVLFLSLIIYSILSSNIKVTSVIKDSTFKVEYSELEVLVKNSTEDLINKISNTNKIFKLNYEKNPIQLYYLDEPKISLTFSLNNYYTNKLQIDSILEEINNILSIDQNKDIISRISSIVNMEVLSTMDEYVIYDSIDNTTQIKCYVSHAGVNISYIKKELVNINPETEVLLVNKYNSIPEKYEVSLVTYDNMPVSDKILEPLENIFLAAKADGVELNITSGYRTYEDQEKLYNDRIFEYIDKGYSYDEAESLTMQYVAKPNHSEHHTGLAVDFSGISNTKMWEWLDNNAYKYGFILRYEEDKMNVTNINYEPWHYYYVGVELATYIYYSDIALEEFVNVTVK